MGQIQCAERDSGGEQRENTPEVGLRVCRRRIRNRVELVAMEIEGLGPTAIEGAGAARRPKSASWFRGFIDGAFSIEAFRNGQRGRFL